MPNRRTATTAIVLSLASPLAALAAQTAAAQTPPVPAPTPPPVPPTPPPVPVPAKPTAHQVDIKATIRVSRQGSLYVGRGTFKGKPFKSGKFETRTNVASVSPLRASAQITITTPTGAVFLSSNLSGPGSSLSGRPHIVHGTGAYRGITGSHLSVSFSSGSTATARLTGSVKFVDVAKKK